jgi:hypothetical protein
LPRNSQREARAKPCWGSLEVAAWSGAVPKTFVQYQYSSLVGSIPLPSPILHPILSLVKNTQEQLLTGNTTGTPPLTALLPSVFAFSLTQSFSLPAASFQLIIVAPKSSTSMLSPDGSTADTRSLECEIVTCACGVKPGVAESADGFFGRSTMVAGIEQGGTSELWCEGSVGLRVLERGYAGK